MIWFALFQFMGFAAVFGLWYLYGKYFHKSVGEAWHDVILDNFKKFFVSFCIMFMALTLVMAKPLYHTSQCSIKGVSMNANTKYSWVMGECLMQTKDGSWIPLKITRGVPNGADTDHDGYPD